MTQHTQHIDTDVVRKTVTVAVSQERAFEAFTAEFGSWWPPEYHIGKADLADFILEPKVGGRWYEVGTDGVECDSGRVLAFEPPERVVIAWHLNGQWQFDPDPEHASHVEVRFIAEGLESTRVELEHRGFERHGDGAAAVRGGVEGGWVNAMGRYAAKLAA